VLTLLCETEGWSQNAIISNDTRAEVQVSYSIVDGDSGAVYLSGEKRVPAGENVLVGSIELNPGLQRLYLITWSIDGKEYGNHYISGFPAYKADQMVKWLKQIAALPDAFELIL
jgi:beta-mannosidase